jgi:hypothetical protein
MVHLADAFDVPWLAFLTTHRAEIASATIRCVSPFICRLRDCRRTSSSSGVSLTLWRLGRHGCRIGCDWPGSTARWISSARPSRRPGLWRCSLDSPLPSHSGCDKLASCLILLRHRPSVSQHRSVTSSVGNFANTSGAIRSSLKAFCRRPSRQCLSAVWWKFAGKSGGFAPISPRRV